MRRSHNKLKSQLKSLGIQPASFAFFLTQFIESKPKTKLTPLGKLLIEQLKAEAKLIEYHLLEDRN
jgi:hypothetical protein